MIVRDLRGIRDGLVACLGQVGQVERWVPGSVTPPVIVLGSPEDESGALTNEGASTLLWPVWVLVAASDPSGQDELDAYLGTADGEKSIQIAVESAAADELLGEHIMACRYAGFDSYGVNNEFGQALYGARVKLEVLC